jgi:hypothetical protein
MSIERIGSSSEENLSALEQRLGSWRPIPASGAVNRDRLVFEAGRAAAGAGAWRRIGWCSNACLALVALGLGGLLARERGDRQALEATLAARASAPASAAMPPVVALEPDSYFVLTHHILAAGANDSMPIVSDQPPDRRPAPPEPPLSPLRARRREGPVDL